MQTFSLGQLPNGHTSVRYNNGEVVVINNVRSVQNGSAYQCTATTPSSFVQSNIGRLYLGTLLN